jgi:hypothetical protein
MIGPVELITLPEALKLVIAHTSSADVARRRPTVRAEYEGMGFFLPEPSENSRDPFAKSNKQSSESWLQRELAVSRLKSACIAGAFGTFVVEPGSGFIITVDPADWRGATYGDEIVRGGVFRASACESLEPHRGKTARVKKHEVMRWLAAEKLRRPTADEGKCQAWLFAGMLASPDQKIKAKREWRIEATQLFGVSVRAFNRAWASAIEASGSTWDQSGAPHKSSQ